VDDVDRKGLGVAVDFLLDRVRAFLSGLEPDGGTDDASRQPTLARNATASTELLTDLADLGPARIPDAPTIVARRPSRST
jgi:hypothetical protein